MPKVTIRLTKADGEVVFREQEWSEQAIQGLKDYLRKKEERHREYVNKILHEDTKEGIQQDSE